MLYQARIQDFTKGTAKFGKWKFLQKRENFLDRARAMKNSAYCDNLLAITLPPTNSCLLFSSSSITFNYTIFGFSKYYLCLSMKLILSIKLVCQLTFYIKRTFFKDKLPSSFYIETMFIYLYYISAPCVAGGWNAQGAAGRGSQGAGFFCVVYSFAPSVYDLKTLMWSQLKL